MHGVSVAPARPGVESNFQQNGSRIQIRNGRDRQTEMELRMPGARLTSRSTGKPPTCSIETDFRCADFTCVRSQLRQSINLHRMLWRRNPDYCQSWEHEEESHLEPSWSHFDRVKSH